MARPEWIDALSHGEIAVLTRQGWQEAADDFEVLASHETHLAGQLLVCQGPSGLVAVEAPKPAERVVRPLRDAEHVQEFVQDRLDTYERMWDGCGCKVDYYR